LAAVVKVAEAKAHLSELLAKVERGEEFVIARGRRPIARLGPLEEKTRGRAAVDATLALRDSGICRRFDGRAVRRDSALVMRLTNYAASLI
jgi:prevent-host-death family protein